MIIKGITKTAHIVRNGCRIQVRNGRDTHFWIDQWIDKKSIDEIIDLQNSNEIRDTKVADLWDEEKDGNEQHYQQSP